MHRPLPALARLPPLAAAAEGDALAVGSPIAGLQVP